MLYYILWPLIGISLRAYFKKVKFLGKEHLQHEGAIYVCNHPSAFIDPLVVAASTSKSYHFLAGAEWFRGGLREWIFKKQFNMIPVVRPWLAKGKELSNDEMFEECYKSLLEGKRILIFPEASSMTVPWIRELKTGSVRMKIGTDAYGKEDTDIPIIPIGLSYSNPHRFQGRVLMHVGEPMYSKDFDDLDIEDEVEKVRAMTNLVRSKMSALVPFSQDEAMLTISQNMLRLTTAVIMKERKVSESDTAGVFQIQKEIIASTQMFKDQDLETFNRFDSALGEYIKDFQALGFRSYNPFETGISEALGKLLLMVIFLPLALVGAIVNTVPYFISQFLFRRLFLSKVTGEHKQGELNPAFAGSMAYAVGVFIFLIWYILGAVTFNLLTGLGWVSLTIILVAYLLGQFTLHYIRWPLQLFKWVKWKTLSSESKQSILNKREVMLTQAREIIAKYGAD